jgi:predicted nucleic acid-binding protein
VAVVLDSDTVIGFLDAGDALHGPADAAIRGLVHDHPLLVSAVTYAEVLTGARLGHHDEAHARGFFDQLITAVLPADAQVADKAADLRARHRALRMPDALILATADTNAEVELIVSGDADAARVRGLRCRVKRLT